MLRNFPICLLVAFVTVGCAGPSQKVENGRYNDYRYNISFATPESWQQVKAVPQNVMPKRNSPNAQYKRSLGCFSDVVFVNASGSGVIAIEFDESVDDASKLRVQEIRKLVEEAQVSRQEILEKAFRISDYRFSATPDCVTEKPLCLSTEWFKYHNQKDFAFETRLFVFVVNNKDTASLRAMLFSETASLERNRLVLDRLLKTITRINADKRVSKTLIVKR